ncbi:MAG TPA: flagellar protein FlgN [Phycisphaerales bacterium]|nr:flagellar protein FlgN [Phycisphaerales bacterium]
MTTHQPMLSPTSLADRLDTLLDALASAYTRLADASDAHREAIRTADTRGVEAAVQRQTVLFRELQKLDHQRRELVALAHASFPALRKTPAERTTLTQLAATAVDTRRGELAVKAGNLRSIVASVQERNASIRSAAASLLAHMEGVMRQVARQMSHTGTYSRRGVVEAAAGVVSAVDLRS